MKTNYFLVALFTLTMLSVNAQFIDDMESYTVGEPINEGHWTNWGIGDGIGHDLMSESGSHGDGEKSGFIPPDTTTGAVLDLGNKTNSVWELEFYMFVPQDKEAYFNLQGSVPIVGNGEFIVGNIFLNQNLTNPGVGLISNSALGAVNFNFPHGQWFRVLMRFDISNGMSLATWDMYVDGEEVIPIGTAFTNLAGTIPTSLGGVNFFSISIDNFLLVDDFIYCEGCNLGIKQNSLLDFSVYPSPTTGILNIESESTIIQIEVYNQLGQLVASNSNQNTIDISRVDAGLYFIKLKDENGNIGTKKVVKE
jgi:hypothetical protein